MAETVQNTTSVDKGSSVWSTIGASLAGAANLFGEAFMARELARITASTQATVAVANAEAARAQATAAQAAAAQAAANNPATNGGFTATLKSLPGWVKWGGGALLALGAGAFILKRI